MAYESNRREVDSLLLNHAMIEGVSAIAGNVARVAIPKAKYRYGHLRASIQAQRAKRSGKKVTAEVGSYDIHYAFDQEFGPYGRPYLRPALREEATPEKIAEAIGNYYGA